MRKSHILKAIVISSVSLLGGCQMTIVHEQDYTIRTNSIVALPCQSFALDDALELEAIDAKKYGEEGNVVGYIKDLRGQNEKLLTYISIIARDIGKCVEYRKETK